MKLRERLGIFRSVAMYYWKPFNKRRLVRFYSQFVKAGDLCFDLGAHLGNRTNAWLALGAKVIAVEPQPTCIRYLKKKFGQNEKVIIVEEAIGAEVGETTLYVSELTPTVSTLADKQWRDTIDEETSFEVHWDQEVDVKVITLDELIAKYGLPAFAKMDIENYEVEALKGLSQALPALSIEFFPATIERAIECIELLEELGNYEFNWSFGESQQLNNEKWLNASAIKKVLSQITRDDPSGDFYARVVY